MGYFEAKILSPSVLLECTRCYHTDDAILIQKHYTAVKNQNYIEVLKKSAISPTYAGKIGKEDYSRALSTKSLEKQQAKERSIHAEAKYQRAAITATLNVQAKAMRGRRSSCVSFLIS